MILAKHRGSQGHKYPFPTDKGKVYGGYTFGTAINRLAYRRKIVDSNGRLFHFQSHQFRHTVGTRMINLDVPQHINQRYLGHKTPEMTNRYAHIHDKTLRAKLEELLGRRIVDITGKAVEQRPQAPLIIPSFPLDCDGSENGPSGRPCVHSVNVSHEGRADDERCQRRPSQPWQA